MIIWAMSFLLRQIAMILIRSTGRVAISTGDFSFLFTTWQGPLLLFIGLSVLFVYLAFDLNSMIIFSDGILKGEPKLFESLKQGFLSIRKFFTPDGIGIVMYIALVAPIIGFPVIFNHLPCPDDHIHPAWHHPYLHSARHPSGQPSFL